MDRERAIELLRSEHDFPGPFRFRVVVRNGGEPGVVSALAALDGVEVDHVDTQPSRKGTYVSVRLRTTIDKPETVLDAYAVLRGIDGVMATL